MGRKALGNVPVTRRISPERAAQLQALEQQGYSLDDVIVSFVEREAPESDVRNQPALALLEAIRFLYSRGGALPVASDYVVEEIIRCHAGQILYPGDVRFRVNPAVCTPEGWRDPAHLRQALIVMRQTLEALHGARRPV